MDLENIEKEFSGRSKVLEELKNIFLRYQEINKLLEDPKTYEDIKSKGAKPFKYYLPVEINNESTPKTWTEKLI